MLVIGKWLLCWRATINNNNRYWNKHHANEHIIAVNSHRNAPKASVFILHGSVLLKTKFNFSRWRHKKIPITGWRWSMTIGGILGTVVREKTEGGSLTRCSPNIWCQEMSIVCVPGWIWMRQKGGDVVDAAWQSPPLRGEESVGSQCSERMLCNKRGYDMALSGFGAVASTRCSMRRLCGVSRVFTHPEKGPLFHQQTLSTC